MTIFGVAWDELDLAHVVAFLDQADDEPLLWEAKGTVLKAKEVRRQVCAFANSHEGGYLILGAEQHSDGNSSDWKLPGVDFPDEPRTWLSNVIADPEQGVRPRPDFDIAVWGAESGHVAVIYVVPTATPPCITNGTVYERLPGKTQTVDDPRLLADLFYRGDQARKDAQARADRAAGLLMEALEGEAGTFVLPMPVAPVEESPEMDALFLRFAIGVATTGNPPNIAGRLFRHEFAEEVWQELADRPTGVPPPYANPPDAVEWSQEALVWRHQVQGPLKSITLLRASWDGAGAAAQKLLTEDAPYLDSLATKRLGPHWQLADELVNRLGGFGDAYVTVLMAGGRFPRRGESGWIVMRRGPLSSGFEEQHVSSFGREMMRAVGNHEPEP